VPADPFVLVILTALMLTFLLGWRYDLLAL
jgi:hypothetical protein